MYHFRRYFSLLAVLVTGLILVGNSQAETRFYKPYVLAKQATGDFADILEQTRVALKQGGMTIVGEYSPYPGAHSLVVTNEALKQTATRSELGGYGAALRVGVTRTDEGVQIAYTNPEYMAIVYRMADSLAGVTASMAGALGRMQEFGSEYGAPEFDLKSYHYMIFMPYFTDQLALAEYDATTAPFRQWKAAWQQEEAALRRCIASICRAKTRPCSEWLCPRARVPTRRLWQRPISRL